MSKGRRPKPYTHRHGNVYLLRPTPPKVEEPTPEVKAQIFELEKDGAKTLRLDDEGRVHRANVDPIDLYVAAEGARAASWLIFSQRARFHRSGYVDFRIATDKETPMWFRVAFEYLRRLEGLIEKGIVKKRAVNFFVHMSSKYGTRHYVIRWERHGHFTPRARASVVLAPPSNDA